MSGKPDQRYIEETGIIYRQDYCLAFEVVRSYGKNYDLFEENQAAHFTEKFTKPIDNLVKLHEDHLPSAGQAPHQAGFKGRFGVRTEYRMTAAGVKDLIENRLWQASAARLPRHVTDVDPGHPLRLLRLRAVHLDSFGNLDDVSNSSAQGFAPAAMPCQGNRSSSCRTADRAHLSPHSLHRHDSDTQGRPDEGPSQGTRQVCR